MKIFRIYAESGYPMMSANKQVNRVGKYIYKHFDGAYKYDQHANECDIYITILYELKEEYGGTKNDVQEMTIDVNITTYSNKLRVNTLEVTPQKRTLGFDLIPPEKLTNLEASKKLIEDIIRKRILKAYSHSITLF